MSISRNEFLREDSLKSLLLNYQPLSDSLSVLKLSDEIRLYEQYKDSELTNRYLEIRINSLCKYCDSMHFLLETSLTGRILKIKFLYSTIASERDRFLSQFYNLDFREPFGTSYPIKTAEGDEKWCFNFMYALKKAAQVVDGTNLYVKNKVEQS